MNAKQVEQFNRMMYVLRKISKGYMTPDQLSRRAEKTYGCSANEAIVMSYENIQQEATNAVRGVRGL